MNTEPAFRLSDAKKVLVLAPHPDDETLGCGGTVALCASQGAEVHVAVISDGGLISQEPGNEGGDIVEMRKREAREAAGILGIRDTYFLDFPDGELRSHKDGIRERLWDIVSEFGPEVILSPSPVDYHADHITVSEIACELLVRLRDLKVAFYEVYETIRFNALMDITSVAHLKEKAILAYRHSLFNVPEVFAEASKGFDTFRSLYTRRVGSYEAFWLVSAPLSAGELISWVTYGLREADPAELFLSKIRGVDRLFFELRGCTASVQAKDNRIRELEGAVAESHESIKLLKARLDAIDESLVWRIALRYYRVRDRLLPPGSHLRRIYQKALSVIKPENRAKN
jgi:N-acetylglucosamine malate deacetylase 1